MDTINEQQVETAIKDAEAASGAINDECLTLFAIGTECAIQRLTLEWLEALSQGDQALADDFARSAFKKEIEFLARARDAGLAEEQIERPSRHQFAQSMLDSVPLPLEVLPTDA